MIQSLGIVLLSWQLLLGSLLVHAHPLIDRLINQQQGGGEVGNGGDPWVIEFIEEALQVADRLALSPEAIDYGVFPDRMKEVIQNAQIESTEFPLSLHGVDKSAINYPEQNRIVFNGPIWNSIIDRSLRRQFVLHEILGLMKIDDHNYRVTSALASDIFDSVDPCFSDQEKFRRRILEIWKKRGHVLHEKSFDSGYGFRTQAGVSILVLKGFEIRKSGSVNALITVGECDPKTKKYRNLGNSGSSAGLRALCPGSSRVYCESPGSLD